MRKKLTFIIIISFILIFTIYLIKSSRYVNRDTKTVTHTEKIASPSSALTAQTLPASDNASVQEKVNEWNQQVMNDPYIKHIRTALNGYLDGTYEGISDPDNAINPSSQDKPNSGLGAFSKEYYQSKFYVMSITQGLFGGEEINIIFADKPDKIFWIWIFTTENGDYDFMGISETESSEKAEAGSIETFVKDNLENNYITI
jgi:hypothetical protein